MENTENKEQEKEKVINLSDFDSFESSSEKSLGDKNKRSKSIGYFLSALGEELFGSDSPEDKKKKIRNLIIIVVNFVLMFIILSSYFGGNDDKERYEKPLPVELMTGEEI